nr:integrase, catalytic region, zinc finger, CCHC-type, peptidase aspartic, catalytic [Tanacetum cinerariifolium]
MLIFSHAPLFLWVEVIATACFTQNPSIIHRRFNETPCELINGRKLDISFLLVFRALCYPKNYRKDIGKLGAKGQFCDSDLDVAFRRNACFVRNLEGLPKFKYHKEHICPSCEQGKSKRASYPSKPVPNSRQRLHLLHMDLCGPMRIASINAK